MQKDTTAKAKASKNYTKGLKDRLMKKILKRCQPLQREESQKVQNTVLPPKEATSPARNQLLL